MKMVSFFYKNSFGYICSLFLLLITIVAIHSNGYSFDFTIRTPSYLYTQWTFSYNYGFIKRALPGEVLQYFNIDQNYKNVRVVSIILFLTLFCLFSKLVYDFFNKIGFENKYIVIYSLCVLSLSYTTTQWLREISRFDHIGQIIFIFLVFLISKDINRYYILLVTIFCLPLMALTHEAMIIFFTPALIYIYYIQYNKKIDVIVISLVSLFLIFFIIVYGKMTSHQANSIIENFYNYNKFQSYAVSTSLLSLQENFNSNLTTFFSTKAYLKIFFAFLFLLPVFLFIKACMRKMDFIYILFFSSAPLALSIIAFDYIRWIALFAFNISVIFIFLVTTNRLNINLVYINFKKYKNTIFLYSVFSLIIGPIGVTNVFINLYESNGPWEKRELWDQKILIKLNDPIPLSKIQLAINDSGFMSKISLLDENNLSEKIIKKYIEEKKYLNAEEKNILGFIYFYGIKTPINYCLALEYFNESASRNNSNAIYNLSLLYRNGVCVQKDIKKANYLLIKSYDYGNDAAKFLLAYSYFYGKNGFIQDKDKAKIILKDSEDIFSKELFSFTDEQ